MKLVGCGLEMQAGSESERVEWGGAALGSALGNGDERGEGEEPGEERERVERGGACCLRGGDQLQYHY